MTQKQPDYLKSAGRYIYGRFRVRAFQVNGKITIGSFVSISKDVTVFLGGNHRPDWVSTFPFPAFSDFEGAIGITGHETTKGDVIIGSDVWIGENATILSGVTIGHGAVVGAYSVVASDVPPYAIVCGNPARIIRHRFSSDQIAELLNIAWWDWPEERLMVSVKKLCSTNIDEFIKTARGAK